MRHYLPALYWAFAMIVLAIGARMGWADRDAVGTLMLVMPILAFTTIVGGNSCHRAGQAR